MSSQPTPVNECIPDLLQPEKVREVLDRPFPPQLVKTRPGNFGQTLSYVEAHEYIRRLNEAFGMAWNFEIVKFGKNIEFIAKAEASSLIQELRGGKHVVPGLIFLNDVPAAFEDRGELD
jgi:hypothetical protein